jgi:hypothetical protein
MVLLSIFGALHYFIHSKNFKIMAKQSSAAADRLTPQEKEILVLYNKMTKAMEALAERSEDGKHKMVPYNDENRNSFLKIDKGASWIENFWKNLVSQFKDPTHFNLLSIQEGQMDDPKIKKALKDLAAGKETQAVKDFLDKYEIRPKQAQDYGIDWEMFKKLGITKEGLEATGMLDDFLNKHAVQAPAQVQQTRFNESLINYAELQNMGISREYLVQRNLLTDLLKGYKSRELVPMTIDNGFVRARIEARIGLMNSPEGLKLMVWGVKQKPAFERPFYGHVFSAEDQRQLLETGNMGRTVELIRDGESVLSFVSRDRLTNDLYATKVEDTFIPKEIKNVQLSEQEMNELREGRAIKLELKSEKGNDYTATIQISAERRGIEYIFENDKLFNAQSLGGKELTQQERDRLNAGETVLVENMIGKDSGAPYDKFVKLEPGTGRPLFFQFNPDSPENARQVIIPKELGGQKVLETDRLSLREGKVIHMKDMVSQKGEALPPFVKLDLQTGRVKYSYDPNKFDEKPRFEVPQEVHGVRLSSLQRAQLQDGKGVLIEGIKGYDGKTISQYAKVSKDQSHLEFSNDNPDLRRSNSQHHSNRQDNAHKRGQSL